MLNTNQLTSPRPSPPLRLEQRLQPIPKRIHMICEMIDFWTSECSHCYSYVHSDGYFYDESNGGHHYEDFTCKYTMPIVCDPDFVDT